AAASPRVSFGDIAGDPVDERHVEDLVADPHIGQDSTAALPQCVRHRIAEVRHGEREDHDQIDAATSDHMLGGSLGEKLRSVEVARAHCRNVTSRSDATAHRKQQQRHYRMRRAPYLSLVWARNGEEDEHRPPRRWLSTDCGGEREGTAWALSC